MSALEELSWSCTSSNPNGLQNPLDRHMQIGSFNHKPLPNKTYLQLRSQFVREFL